MFCFLTDDLYQVEEVPFYSKFAECFYYDRVLDFVKCFLSVEIYHVIFVLYSINMVYYID